MSAALAVLFLAAIFGGAVWYGTHRMPADLANKRQVFTDRQGELRRVVTHRTKQTFAYTGTIAEVVDDGITLQLRSSQASIPFTDIIGITTVDKTPIAIWGASPTMVAVALKEYR